MRPLLTLAALVVCCSIAHAEPPDCFDAKWLGAVGLPKQNCQQRGAKKRGAQTLRVVQMSGDTLTQKDADTLTPRVLGWLDAAMTKYASLVPTITQRDVTVVFVPDKAKQLATTLVGLNDECVILLFPYRPMDVPANELEVSLRFAVVHEGAHCLQQWSVKPQMKADGRKWWSEGSADYLAHHVFDSRADLEDAYGDFNDDSPSVPFTQLEYQTFVFWSWYGKSYGTKAVVDAWAKMPKQNGEGAQRAALKALIHDDHLRLFTDAYLDGKVTTPQGWAFTAPELQASAQFSKSDTKTLEVDPFTLRRGTIELKEGSYALALDATPPPRVKLDGAWTVLEGERVMGAACKKDDLVVPYALFSTSAKTVKIKVRAKREDSEEACACARTERDPCVVGSWVLDTDAMQKNLDDGLVRAQQSTGGSAVNGDSRMSIAADGKATMTLDQLEVAAATRTPAAMTVVTSNGKVVATWSSHGNELRMCTTSDDVKVDIALQLFTAAGTLKKSDTVKQDMPRREYSYTCKGNRLTMRPKPEHEIGGVPVEWVYRRGK